MNPLAGNKNVDLADNEREQLKQFLLQKYLRPEIIQKKHDVGSVVNNFAELGARLHSGASRARTGDKFDDSFFNKLRQQNDAELKGALSERRAAVDDADKLTRLAHAEDKMRAEREGVKRESARYQALANPNSTESQLMRHMYFKRMGSLPRFTDEAGNPVEPSGLQLQQALAGGGSSGGINPYQMAQLGLAQSREQRQSEAEEFDRILARNREQRQATESNARIENQRETLRLKQSEIEEGRRNRQTELAIPGWRSNGLVRVPKTEAAKLRAATSRFAALKGKLSELTKLIAQYGSFEVANQEAGGRMASLAREAQLDIKEVKNLGVLNGPDLSIIEQLIPDTDSPGAALRQLFQRKEADIARIQQTMRSAEADLHRVMNANGYERVGSAGVRTQTPGYSSGKEKVVPPQDASGAGKVNPRSGRKVMKASELP